MTLVRRILISMWPFGALMMALMAGLGFLDPRMYHSGPYGLHEMVFGVSEMAVGGRCSVACCFFPHFVGFGARIILPLSPKSFNLFSQGSLNSQE